MTNLRVNDLVDASYLNLRVNDLVDASYLNDAEDVNFQTNGAKNEMLRPEAGWEHLLWYKERILLVPR